MLSLLTDTQTSIKIHLTTKIKLDQDEETYELTVFGRHYQKGDTIYLKYDEIQEQGTIHTVVKITKDEAFILRTGLLKMRLNFKLNEQKRGSHESELGTLFLTTNTKRFTHNETNDHCDGKLSLAYELSMQGKLAGFYEMEIVYKEEEGNQ
ncbi:hypothetical protein ACA30_04670 [Virgibacillus soli]|uniref:DUF1934 domain-containing protein n=1 Tax=Lederbergia galactosidilytica TaxID=217031 RepID=A0A177ZI83_9BACI|nr:hypothetical protein ACA30_04670 [Virgibacillus soli]OAK67525.1 hypothetical protein ABB05_20590 [Lederbergia galactosidilytica]